MEVLTGLGMMLGPLLGTVLYQLGGYACPFYVFTVVVVVPTPFIIRLLPSAPNASSVLSSPITSNPLLMPGHSESSLSVFRILKNHRVSMTIVYLILCILGTSYLLPVLTIHLQNLGVAKKNVGYFFIIPTLAYSLNMLLIARLPKNIDRHVYLHLGGLVMVLAFLLLGPEEALHLPHSIYTTCVGLFLIGVGCSIVMVPSIPVLIGHITLCYPDPEDKNRVSDMASAFFQTSIYISGFIGPNCASLLTEGLGFSRGCTVISLLLFSYQILFFVFVDGMKAFRTIKHRTDANPLQMSL